MAKFRITGPDGGVYEVTAPDDASEQDVLGYVQQNAGAAGQAGPTNQTGTPRAAEDRSMAALAASDPSVALRNRSGELRGQKASGTLVDRVRSLASGASFGLADEFAALMSKLTGVGGQPGADGTYSGNLAAERRRDAQIPSDVRIPGEIAGGLLTGSGLARQGATLLNMAKPTISGMALRGGAEGAAYGAAHGFGQGEGEQDRLEKAAYGAALGAPTGAVTAGVGTALAKPKTQSVPRSEQIRAKSDAMYKAADDSGVLVSTPATRNIADDVMDTARRAGLRPVIHKELNDAIKYLDDLAANPASGKGISLRDLETARQVIRDASKQPSQYRIAAKIIDKLDDRMDALSANDVIAGDAKLGPEALGQARQLWSTFRKTKSVERLIERAELKAGFYSGSGYENALRSEFRNFLLNENKIKGFSKPELDAIRKVADGGPIQNLMRFIGKAAPTGIVSGGIGYTAGKMSGIPGAEYAIPGVGALARLGATGATSRSAEKALGTVSGIQPQAMPRLTPEQLELIRALMIAQAQGAPSLMGTGRQPSLMQGFNTAR